MTIHAMIVEDLITELNRVSDEQEDPDAGVYIRIDGKFYKVTDVEYDPGVEAESIGPDGDGDVDNGTESRVYLTVEAE